MRGGGIGVRCAIPTQVTRCVPGGRAPVGAGEKLEGENGMVSNKHQGILKNKLFKAISCFPAGFVSCVTVWRFPPSTLRKPLPHLLPSPDQARASDTGAHKDRETRNFGHLPPYLPTSLLRLRRFPFPSSTFMITPLYCTPSPSSSSSSSYLN